MPYAAVNGLNLYYEIHGDGSPLLLLYGGAGSIPEKWIAFFTPQFRVIAPEQMGHGRTADLVDRPFHYHDMAEDTVELMRRLGIESAVIVGYSDGGIIGLDMAIHHPERVTRLAVTGANARFDGYTADNQELVSSFDPGSEPVSETYAQLSPDGAEHWPVVLGRLQRMWAAEPSVTNEELRGWLGRRRLRLWRSLRHSREQLLVECGSWFDARRPPTSLVFGLSGGNNSIPGGSNPPRPPTPAKR